MKNILLLFVVITHSFACYSQAPKSSFSIIGGIQDELLKQKIEQNTTKLLQGLNESFDKGKEQLQFDEGIVTSAGLEKISDLWKESHFFCSAEKIAENLIMKGNIYQVRNIPFVFGVSDKFDVVVEYLPDGRIDDFYIALETNQYKSVLDATSVIDQTRREIILNFLENLRTSYIKKDINYISKLYSDKALIITGKVIKVQDISTDHIQKNFTKNQIEYQVSTKSEYINKLKSIFNSISYLRLDFKNIEVVKHRKHPNFYGILLRQIWETPRYKDDGLLFLLVQFKENEDPIIWVRTWQDALNTPPGEVFGLHNFKITTGEIIN